MKTKQILITLLIAFLAISSSFSQTKRFINEQYIFNVNPKSAGYDFKVLDSITASDTLALINNSVLGGKWVRGRNLPVKDVDINNYSHNGTLFSYLQGIDLALGAIEETTAGVLTSIFFTGDETTLSSGTYYLSNTDGRGTVSEVVQTVNNADNTKSFFAQDVISSPTLLSDQATKGNYTANLTVLTEGAGTGNDYSQRFTLEIYLTDNNGVPINSGVTGAPIGDLGVTVLTILDSGVLNMPYDAITNITLTGNLNENVDLLVGNRIRYHISAEKIGTSGGAVDQSLYFGSNHNTYYNVPTPILWGDVKGLLSNQVDLQNALDAKEDIANKGVADGYASLDPSGKVPLSQINKDITIGLIGQSNALGWNAGGDMTTDSRVFVWRKDLTTPSWQVADLTQPPFNGNNNLGFHFAKKYAETYDVNVRIIVNAQGGESILRWSEDDGNDYMWDDLVAQVSASGTTKLDIVLWHQGEALPDRNSTVDFYATEMNKLHDRLELQSWYDKDTPFIAGELTQTYPTVNNFYQNYRFNKLFIRKNFTVASRDELEGNPLDPIPYLHYTGEELVILGKEKYWNAWKSLSEQYIPQIERIFKRPESFGLSFGEYAKDNLTPDFDPTIYVNGSSIVPLNIVSSGISQFNILELYRDSAFPINLDFRKARGTIDTPSANLLNDRLGNINFYGWVDGNWKISANISNQVTQDWTTGNIGSKLEFTTNSTGNSSSVKLSLEPNGVVTAPSSTNTEIDNQGGKSLIPKEYADANYLNKNNFYEEGTFTPVLIDEGGGATYSYSVAAGTRYVRVGNTVTVNIVITGINTTGTPTGNVVLNTFPFLPYNGSATLNVGQFSGSSVTFYSITSLLSGTGDLRFGVQRNLDGNFNSALDSCTFTNGAIYITGTYITNVYTP